MEKKIEDLLTRVPGYNGYRAKEDRRDDDRRVREAIAADLDVTVSTLTKVSASLAEQRALRNISTIERLVGSTRLLADRVRSASYGYGGIFTDRPVDDFALTQLRQFDEAFQQESRKLDELANRIASSPEGPLDVDITAYQDELNRIGQLFDARTGVVDSARPNQDAAVLSLLEPKVETKPSPLATLKVGDALSILGDNYIVDATVMFTEPDRHVTLSRVGDDGQGNPVWVVGGTTEDARSAKVTESQGGGAAPGNGRAADAVVATKTETRESVPAQYAYTASTEGSVTFQYSIGGESRSFTGEPIEETDIEVYGQA